MYHSLFDVTLPPFHAGKTERFHMTLKKIDIVFSINVHEKPEFLKRQIDNITKYVQGSHCIILSCNDYMANELKNHTLPNTVIINPEVLNKVRGEGTLTQGIVSNLYYAFNNITFNYFTVLSSRNMFYKTMSTHDIDIVQKTCLSLEEFDKIRIKPINDHDYRDWWWPNFRETLLATHYLKLGYGLYGSEHEGLCFSYHVCKNIIHFFDTHTDIRDDLFLAKSCVEEFGLQTIAFNEYNPDNKHYGYINLGQGVFNNCNHAAENKYMCKIDRI
jgi:hypothetical protein